MAFAQTTVFYDDFNRTPISPGGSPLMTYTATNTSNTGSPIIESVAATGTVPYLKIIGYLSSGPTAGSSYMTGPFSTFLPQFSSTLSSNQGLVSWLVNVRHNYNGSTGTLAGRFVGVVLAASESNLLSPTCTGYAISQATGTTSGYQLIKFGAGLGTTGTFTTIGSIGGVTTGVRDYFNLKVTYDPATNNWSLYQTSGTAFSDPSTVSTQVGTTTVDNTYTGVPMQVFGYFMSHTASTTAFNVYYDNFKVTVNVPVTWISGWPKAENATPTGFTVKSETNVASKTYFVVLPTGANAPTSTQIKAGQDAAGTALETSKTGSIITSSGSTEAASAVTGLSSSTTYDVYFVAEDAQGSNLQASPVKVTVFTTANASAPIVSNPTATTFTNNSAILGGNITSDGGSSITERGIVWKTSSGVALTDNKVVEGGTSTGIFTQSCSSLPPKSKIYYMAYAINSIGSALSSEDNFFTLADEPIDQVTGLTATLTPGSTNSSIDLSWTAATSADGYIILYRNSSVATTGIPSDGGVYDVGSSIGNGTVLAYLPASTTAKTVSGLVAGSKYSFTVFSYNSDGINPQTYNYNSSAAPSATATTDMNTGVNLSKQDSPVCISNGKLIIFGGEVYNSVGMKVASVKLSVRKTELALRSGVYIVKTSKGAQKVVVQ